VAGSDMVTIATVPSCSYFTLAMRHSPRVGRQA
jgi:hypothetical protein